MRSQKYTQVIQSRTAAFEKVLRIERINMQFILNNWYLFHNRGCKLGLGLHPSIRDGVHRSGMPLYLHLKRK